MFEYINGKVTIIESGYIVIDNNGIGYKIFVGSPYSFNIDEEYKVYLYQNIREDENTLFGFKTKEESAILADHNNTVRDIKEMMALIDQMSTTIATQAQMIDTRDQLLDEAYLKLESAETELIIRRKNDEFRQKLAVMK